MAESEKVYYSTTAVNTGGRNGESHLLDRSFEVKVSTPKKMGGPGQGTNPEQLFAMGYSACFNGALEHFMEEEKIQNPSQVTHTVRLLEDPSDNGFQLDVKIEVAIQDTAEDKVQELMEKAHGFCPYSKAVSGNVPVDLKVVPYEENK